MTKELIYPDFCGKTRHYTKREIESEPVVYLTEQEVNDIGQFTADAALNPEPKETA